MTVVDLVRRAYWTGFMLGLLTGAGAVTTVAILVALYVKRH